MPQSTYIHDRMKNNFLIRTWTRQCPDEYESRTGINYQLAADNYWYCSWGIDRQSVQNKFHNYMHTNSMYYSVNDSKYHQDRYSYH